MSKIDFSISDRIDWAAEVPVIAWPDEAGPERAPLRALRKAEFAIARHFHKGASWPYYTIALVSFAVWLAVLVLAVRDEINPLVACLLSTLISIGGYVTGHEAMHGNLKGKSRASRWGNDLVGWIALVPIVIPFSLARITHVAHHAHCNDPLRDPDYCDGASNGWAALYKTWYNRQPGVQGVSYHYRRVLTAMGTPEAAAALRQTALYQLGYLAALFALAWSGHAIAAAAVWWLPRQLALSYIRLSFSWAPHHPRAGTGRYDNTRIFRSQFGHFLSLGMQYHLIHHLYPHIKIHRNKPAFAAMRHILEARGVDCSALPAETVYS